MGCRLGRRRQHQNKKALTINQGFPYDVSADGQRFIVNTIAPRGSEPVVLGVELARAGSPLRLEGRALVSLSARFHRAQTAAPNERAAPAPNR